MSEQFRKVEPLDDERCCVNLYNNELIDVSRGFTVPEARALRDWLNRALPGEKT